VSGATIRKQATSPDARNRVENGIMSLLRRSTTQISRSKLPEQADPLYRV